ncbi:MAG: hypothetical protein KAW95_01450, partial [Dehalococcoidia bacterium]|nr:hypothetical protein [Dehalococcoidia bacterium]
LIASNHHPSFPETAFHTSPAFVLPLPFLTAVCYTCNLCSSVLHGETGWPQHYQRSRPFQFSPGP